MDRIHLPLDVRLFGYRIRDASLCETCRTLDHNVVYYTNIYFDHVCEQVSTLWEIFIVMCVHYCLCLTYVAVGGWENFSGSADRQSFAEGAVHAPRNCKLDQWRF